MRNLCCDEVGTVQTLHRRAFPKQSPPRDNPLKQSMKKQTLCRRISSEHQYEPTETPMRRDQPCKLDAFWGATLQGGLWVRSGRGRKKGPEVRSGGRLESSRVWPHRCRTAEFCRGPQPAKPSPAGPSAPPPRYLCPPEAGACEAVRAATAPRSFRQAVARARAETNETPWRPVLPEFGDGERPTGRWPQDVPLVGQLCGGLCGGCEKQPRSPKGGRPKPPTGIDPTSGRNGSLASPARCPKGCATKRPEFPRSARRMASKSSSDVCEHWPDRHDVSCLA